MRVSLVYTNTYDYLSPQPIGLSLLTEPLKKAGHEVQLIDFMKVDDPDTLLRNSLNEFKPDMVGLSFRNMDNQDFKSPQNCIPDYIKWVDIANEYAPTIIGGSAAMTAPEKMYDVTRATYALIGQGDKAFPQFLSEFGSGQNDFKAPGLMWRDNGEVKKNDGIFNGYKEGGTIDWSVIDRKRYKKSFMNNCVITKTGCPHKCIFCDTRESFGSVFMTRSPEAIIEDLKRDRAEYGLHKQDYFFIDAMFNQPIEWAKSVLESIINSDLKLSFSVIIEPSADIDREFANLLRKAGCGMVTTLLGSADEELIAKMRRPFTLESTNRAFEIFQKEKVPYMPQFMLGGPGETRETIGNNIKIIKKWKPIMVDANYGIRIMPKAELRDIAIEEGIITEDTDLMQPTFYVSEELQNDYEWLDKKVKEIKRFRLGSIWQWADLMIRGIKNGFQ